MCFSFTALYWPLPQKWSLDDDCLWHTVVAVTGIEIFDPHLEDSHATTGESSRRRSRKVLQSVSSVAKLHVCRAAPAICKAPW